MYFCPRNDGALAQSVEQRTENPCVPGSIPGGTTFKILASLSAAADDFGRYNK